MKKIEDFFDFKKYASMLAEQRQYLYTELTQLSERKIISEYDLERINKKMVKMLRQNFPELKPIGYNYSNFE